MAIELIYCAAGNKEFAQIAIETGYLYGAQVPNTVYFPPYFCDQNWKKPNRERYMAALAQYRPHIASVLDWEQEEQLKEVLEWAEEVARWVEVVMLIPKVIGGISRLPRVIGGKPVRLGYSVPTKFGGTSVPIWEFFGRPVHLLGGSPHRQFSLAHYLDVVSVDGNMHHAMAVRHCAFYTNKRVPGAKNHPWVSLSDADGKKWGDGSDTANAPYEAFQRSCENIKKLWQDHTHPY